MRALPCLIGLLAIWPAPPAGAAEPEAIEVSAVARRLDAERPRMTHLGRLRIMGVLELSSPDWRFGGLSALHVEADGGRLTAVTDEGHWFTARLAYDAEGRLGGLSEAALAPLRDPDGARLTSKLTQDAESLTPLPSGGLLVAFEHEHRLWAYGGDGAAVFGAARPLALPPGFERLPRNDGIEAMATLADGSILVIASHTAGQPNFPAFLRRAGAWQPLAYRYSPPFEPTGAATLPDGDLLVIERHFSMVGGLRVRLMRVPAARIAPGAVLQGEVLARFEPPMLYDNLEGVATRRGPGGESLIYLLSDDNFNPLQRTVLLMFALEEG